MGPRGASIWLRRRTRLDGVLARNVCPIEGPRRWFGPTCSAYTSDEGVTRQGLTAWQISISVNNTNVRAYRQVARAAAVEETRTRILDAVETLFWDRENIEYSLEEVAVAAGTTVQTILRHFGSKTELTGAAAARGAGRVQAEREEVPPGDLLAVTAYLARHYEEQGNRMIRLLALEPRFSEVARVIANGRAVHRRFVERALMPCFVRPLGRAQHRRLAATLVAVTDLLTWKVLRREQGLSQSDYQRCIEEMLEALLERTIASAPKEKSGDDGQT